MKALISVCLAVLLAGCATAQDLVDHKAHPVIGIWKWVRPADCPEVFIYRNDGTRTAFRGARRFEETFSVSPEPNDAGLYVVDGVTHFNSEGADCTGGSEDYTGKPLTIYLRFDPSFQLMWVYDDPTGKHGSGPLLRIPN